MFLKFLTAYEYFNAVQTVLELLISSSFLSAIYEVLIASQQQVRVSNTISANCQSTAGLCQQYLTY